MTLIQGCFNNVDAEMRIAGFTRNICSTWMLNKMSVGVSVGPWLIAVSNKSSSKCSSNSCAYSKTFAKTPENDGSKSYKRGLSLQMLSSSIAVTQGELGAATLQPASDHYQCSISHDLRFEDLVLNRIFHDFPKDACHILSQ